jgi:hypothetical protein
MNTTTTNNIRNPRGYFIKRLIFLFLRLRQKITLYEGEVKETGHRLSLVHIGDVNRSRAFIETLFGHIPEPKRLGSRFYWSAPREVPSAWRPCDILLVETNRLCAGRSRRAGFFTIPEWVEFGRKVVADPSLRYHGASKSLKSDLNKIHGSQFNVAITRDIRDFDAFYDTMYLPHARLRFGKSAIIKKRRALAKDFGSGFLLLLKDGARPIAGSLVKEEGDIITETTLGVLSGEDTFLRMGVSGAIDYHLLDWAASNKKTYMKVGHTRPFPQDGVYRNKRKWLMGIFPDTDGVMDMAVRIRRFDQAMATVLRQWPFVFQTPKGLAVFCGHDGDEPAGGKEIQKLIQGHTVEGLDDIVIVSAAGYQKDAYPVTNNRLHRPNVHLFTTIHQATAWQLTAGGMKKNIGPAA